MKLGELLERKGGHAVTVSETTSVGEAIRAMHDNKVGSVVIINNDAYPIGIFTERDVMRLCADGRGGNLNEMTISDYMTRDVEFGSPNDRVVDILNLMTERRFRRIPVVVDSKIVGVLSIGDLVKAKLEETEHDAEALREYIAS